MSKKPSKHGPNKGKGSYRREAFQSNSWEASYFLAA